MHCNVGVVTKKLINLGISSFISVSNLLHCLQVGKININNGQTLEVNLDLEKSTKRNHLNPILFRGFATQQWREW